HIDVPLLRPRRFVLDEGAFRPDRALAPRDDHAFGCVELGLDRLAPCGAAADLLVPPNRIAVRLQRFHQRLHPPPVFRLVRDEHVTHQSAPCRPFNMVNVMLTTFVGGRETCAGIIGMPWTPPSSTDALRSPTRRTSWNALATTRASRRRRAPSAAA